MKTRFLDLYIKSCMQSHCFTEKFHSSRYFVGSESRPCFVSSDLNLVPGNQYAAPDSLAADNCCPWCELSRDISDYWSLQKPLDTQYICKVFPLYELSCEPSVYWNRKMLKSIPYICKVFPLCEFWCEPVSDLQM